MKLYKLTDQEGKTFGGTQWGKDITHTVSVIKNPKLCSKDIIHAYRDINLAFLLNLIHGNFDNPKVWEAEGDICVEDWGKVGCFNLKTVRQIDAPEWIGGKKERFVRIKFAILCAEAVLLIFEKKYPEDKRPRKSIEAAKGYLKNPSIDNDVAAYAAAYADDAAAYAAAAAYNAAAAYAAYAALNAAAAMDKKINFSDLAEQAINEHADD
jgi:hypothetical protein